MASREGIRLRHLILPNQFTPHSAFVAADYARWFRRMLQVVRSNLFWTLHSPLHEGYAVTQYEPLN